MRWVALLLPGLSLLWIPSSLLAQQTAPADDSDLSRIPAGVLGNQATPATSTPANTALAQSASDSASYHVYLDSALTNAAAPTFYPDASGNGWTSLSSLDGVYQDHLPNNFSFDVSGRLNLLAQKNIGEGWWNDAGFDLREAYVSWFSQSQFYVDLGRINLRNGVSLGFNPTDYFKTSTLIDQVSADPATIRNDRLGTTMLRLQQLWTGGSIMFAFAPKLEDPAPITGDFHSGFGLLSGHTNGEDRLLLAGTYQFDGLSPQWLVYHQDGETTYGLNLSHTIGDSIVAYAEWSGTHEQNLIQRAMQYGLETDSLPTDVSLLAPENTAAVFSSDAVLGASWSGAKQWTVNFEYQIHQSGLSGQQLKQWLSAASASPVSYGQFFEYVRGYAEDQQEPLVNRQYFVRVNCVDAFVRNLELSAFAFVDAHDGSGFTQFSASYYLNDHWTMTGLVGGTWGGRHSEYGSVTSFNDSRSVTLEVIRYF
jgi:hypothetical protein